MPGIRSILVAPGEGAARALPQARALAGALGARLAEAGAAQPAEAAGQWAAGADLLVLSPAQDPATQRHRPAPADWQLLRHSPCAVLLTRGDAVRRYQRVLVAVDPLHSHAKPADLDDALIGFARALAADATAALTLLHCHSADQYVPFRAPGAVPGRLLQRESDALAELARRQAVPAGCVRLEAGDPREVIAAAAESGGADLVVLGAMSRSRVGRLLIGSTTEAVIGRLGCDVLAVPAASRPS